MQYLAIDTTSNIVKVSILTDKTGLTGIVEDLGFQQAADLTPFIDKFLKDNDVKIQDFDSIIVNLGPGSYTSLRIGIATAKGLALPHDIKVIGVNSFDVYRHFYINDELNPYSNAAIILWNTPKQAYVQINEKNYVTDITKLNELIPKGTNIYGNGMDSPIYQEYLTSFNQIAGTSSIIGEDLIQYVLDTKNYDTNLEPLYIKPLSYKKTCEK